MRRRFTVPFAAAGLALAVFSILPVGGPAGASERPDRGAAVAVVTGDATSPLAVVTNGLVHALDRAFDRGAGFAVVDAGGRPKLYSVGLGGSFGNSDAREAAMAGMLALVAHALDRVVPRTPQSDPWTAVAEAVGWLQGQGGGTLFLENSGLGTTGFLNYRQAGLLDAAPQELVTFARAHHELPDARGLRVVLVGIGWTAEPQPPLGAPSRANLVAQWRALLRAAGASVSVDPTPLTGAGPAHAPRVSIVKLQETAWRPPDGTCGAAIDATELHFAVGTATLLDPAAAANVLQGLVPFLVAHHLVVSVTGTTSSEGGPAINDPLSTARAEKIAALLEQLGLPPAQIGSVVGLATRFQGFVPDTGPGGTLLPGPAAEDRQVILTWACVPGVTAPHVGST